VRNSPRRVLHAVAAAVAAHVLEESETCRVLIEARALAAHEPAIAEAVWSADTRTHEQLEGLFAAGVAAGEWPAGTDPALQARLFTAGLSGMMAQWHLAPGSFSWQAAAAALAGSSGARPRLPSTPRLSASASGTARSCGPRRCCATGTTAWCGYRAGSMWQVATVNRRA
jgi:transcriptional regulator BetI-like protein